MFVKGSPWAAPRTAGPQALGAGSVRSRKQEVPVLLEQPGEVDSSLKWAWIEQATLYRKLSQLRNEQPGSDKLQGKLQTLCWKEERNYCELPGLPGKSLSNANSNHSPSKWKSSCPERIGGGEGKAGWWYVDRGKPFTVHLFMLFLF